MVRMLHNTGGGIMSMQKYMKQPLMKADCECGFMVQSHDEKEIIGVVQSHAKSIHHMKKLPREEIKSKIKMA